MANTVLAVDKNAAVHKRETAAWEKYGIGSLRVEMMSEAIKLLARRGDFLFIVINEDTIPDFMFQLCIMRDVTRLPIFVITSSYTIEKKVNAMGCGADVYDSFDTYAKDSVISALALLKTQNRRAKRPQKPFRILTGGDIILSPLRRNVFINDTEVPLTKKEFDVLQLLMANNDYVVTHERLLREIWGDNHDLNKTDVVLRTVDSLRGKISEISKANKYIEVEHGVGCRFTPKCR